MSNVHNMTISLFKKVNENLAFISSIQEHHDLEMWENQTECKIFTPEPFYIKLYTNQKCDVKEIYLRYFPERLKNTY